MTRRGGACVLFQVAEAGDFQLKANWTTQGKLVSKPNSPGMMIHAFNPSTGEAESGGSQGVQAN